MDELSIAQKQDVAQLRKLELENAKLEFELKKHEKAPAWYYFPIQLVPLITAMVSVAGFLWGVVQYTNEQQKNRIDRDTQSRQANQTAEREFMKPWLESQRSIYLEALTAVAIAANSEESNERSVAEKQFWQLYHGRMILVETKAVSNAMVSFGRCLDGTDTCNSTEKNTRAKRLATVMAESMAATANMSYQQFSDNKFRYN